MLVCSGNPPRGHTPPAAPDRAGLRDRLVRVATSASGDGASLTSQTKGATVVLEAIPGAARLSGIVMLWLRGRSALFRAALGQGAVLLSAAGAGRAFRRLFISRRGLRASAGL